jgi:hypothetical protein
MLLIWHILVLDILCTMHPTLPSLLNRKTYNYSLCHSFQYSPHQQ